MPAPENRTRPIAMVTGGAKGIGRAVSEALAATWDLVLCGRDPASLSSAAAELSARHAAQVHWRPVDLSRPGAARELLSWCAEQGFAARALIANASDYGTLGNLGDVDFDSWRRSFDLNFFAQAELVHAYLTLGPKTGRRKILLLSGAGLGGAKVWPGISAYACAKAAIYRLVETVHVEYAADGVDINCLAPGAVNTGMTAQALARGRGALGVLYDASVSVRDGAGEPPELAAEMAAFLVSPEADGISGRLVSAKWDRGLLDSPERRSRLATDPDLYRLRRIDDELYAPKRQNSGA